MQGLDEAAQHNLDEGTEEGGPEVPGQPEGRPYGNSGPDEREVRPHDHGQPVPDGTDPDRLDDGRQAGHEERRAHDEGVVLQGEAEGIVDDERDGDDTGEGREDMLDRQSDRQEKGRPVVDPVLDLRIAAGLFGIRNFYLRITHDGTSFSRAEVPFLSRINV